MSQAEAGEQHNYREGSQWSERFWGLLDRIEHASWKIIATSQSRYSAFFTIVSKVGEPYHIFCAPIIPVQAFRTLLLNFMKTNQILFLTWNR